jgi:hypothetical protein
MHSLVAPVDQVLDEPVPKEDLPAPDGPATKNIVPRGKVTAASWVSDFFSECAPRGLL